LGRSGDFLFLLGFTIVHARVTALMLRAAARRWTGPARSFALAGILLLNLLLIAGYALSYSEVLAILRLPTRAGAYWTAAMMAYVMIAGPAMLVREALRRALRRRPDADPGRRRMLTAATTAAIGVPAAAIGFGTFIERTRFRVREVDAPIAGLAPDLEGLRILQLSDIHRGAFLSDAELGRVVDAAAGIRAHVAVVTGDLISTWGDPLDSCLAQLARVKADAGVFGCMGNHERYADALDYTERAAARIGIRFLRSARATLRFGSASVNLAGVDYQPMTDKKEYLRGAEQLLDAGACNILLSHNPDVFPVAARQGYNLLLAGHTHGGQIQAEILDAALNPARFVTPYVYGVYRAGGAAAYVTRGIGTIGMPARIGAPPEISVVRLRKA
jgi:predicted MPP superfamily phosphohydrolase